MKSLLAGFRSTINQWEDAFREDTAFVKYTQFSYDRCIDWFGAPPDPDWPYTVMQGTYNGCQRNRLLKSYYIFLQPQLIGTQNRLELLGHEMYHRVTWKRTGITHSVWVDEMLAIRTSLRLLSAKGYVALSNKIEDHHRRSTAKLPIERFQTILPRRPMFLLPQKYPEEFVSTATCLGAALDALVGWKKVCRMVGSLTWEEWLHTLPEQKRSPVLFLLASLPSIKPSFSQIYNIEEDLRSLDSRPRAAFGLALFYLGNTAEARLQCLKAAEQDSAYSTPYSHLGQIFKAEEQYEEALQAYRAAVEREPDCVTDHSTMAQILELLDRQEEALLEWQCAANLEPTGPAIRYRFANALYETGRIEEAIREWNWVAEQDGLAAEAARMRLEEANGTIIISTSSTPTP